MLSPKIDRVTLRWIFELAGRGSRAYPAARSAMAAIICGEYVRKHFDCCEIIADDRPVMLPPRSSSWTPNIFSQQDDRHRWT